MSLPLQIATVAVANLSENNAWVAVVIVVVFVLAAGGVVVWGRRALMGAPMKLPRRKKKGESAGDEPQREEKGKSAGDEGEGSLVRSWLAISLVGGLLIFTALSFGFDDSTIASTLIGGVVANAGAAVAFYFASKASDQARKDILNAALPTVLVPDLGGKDLAGAQAAMAKLPLSLVTKPADPAKGWTVAKQEPAANTPTHSGSAITATLEKPADP